MKSEKIKSFCKINLSLKVLKRLSNGYHSIESLVTFSDVHDEISISKIKSLKDKVSFFGRFKSRINNKSNTVTKLLNLLRKKNLIKNHFFKIKIKKNIPHGSGLGGGSSNAAALLNYLNFKMKLKLSKSKLIKLAYLVGSDVPLNIEKKNSFVTNKKEKILRTNKKFKLNLLIEEKVKLFDLNLNNSFIFFLIFALLIKFLFF